MGSRGWVERPVISHHTFQVSKRGTPMDHDPPTPVALVAADVPPRQLTLRAGPM